jgi:hypothetical protein
LTAEELKQEEENRAGSAAGIALDDDEDKSRIEMTIRELRVTNEDL